MIATLLTAAAQSVSSAATMPQDPPTVVVRGRAPNHERAVRHMTATIAPVGDADRPLPRFAAPICPEAAGLPEAAAIRFADRMREAARRVGVPVDAIGCAPNITVMFVPDGQAVVRTIHRARPQLFGTLEPYQIRQLEADRGPVHLWSFTELRSRDDDRLRVGTVTGKDVPELQVRSASIIQSPVRIVVGGAIMLIDQGAAMGKTLGQLADYATMRILAQARAVGSAAAEPTILRLFDDTVPQVALTTFDAAYLKALYRGEATERPLTKVGAMARSINRELARSTAPAKEP